MFCNDRVGVPEVNAADIADGVALTNARGSVYVLGWLWGPKSITTVDVRSLEISVSRV